MISLLVDLPWGHFRVPGNNETLGLTQTYECVPVTTVIGFLESMCGEERGSFKASGSKLAHGWVQRPSGRGTVLRKDQASASGGIGKALMVIRPVRKALLYGMVIRVVVEGAYEERLREALRGERGRYGGPLYLGESDNPVEWVSEGEAPTEWVVENPRGRMALPVKTPGKRGFAGYGDRSAELARFSYTEPLTEIPSGVWREAR